MRMLYPMLLLACTLAAQTPDSLVCPASFTREELSAQLCTLMLSAGQADLAWCEAADSLAAGPITGADLLRALPPDAEIVILSLRREQLLSHFGTALDPGEAYVVRLALLAPDAQAAIDRLELPSTRAQRTGKWLHALVRRWLAHE